MSPREGVMHQAMWSVHRGPVTVRMEMPCTDIIINGPTAMIVPAGEPWYMVSGLRATPGQAQALSTRAGAEWPAFRWIISMRAESGSFIISDLPVSEAEAQAIANGRDPLAVLLGRLTVRRLSDQELIA